jgi:hypothetical protein
VEEGEIGGGVAVVPDQAAQVAALAVTNSTAASIPRPWTTAIAPR